MKFCSMQYFFRYTSMQAQPSFVEAGDKVRSSVNAISLAVNFIETLKVTVTLDHKEIFKEETPYRQTYIEGENLEFEYEYEIPKDKGPGDYNINIQLVDSKFQSVICTDTYFKLE